VVVVYWMGNDGWVAKMRCIQTVGEMGPLYLMLDSHLCAHGSLSSLRTRKIRLSSIEGFVIDARGEALASRP
jgi:hypothetical protein